MIDVVREALDELVPPADEAAEWEDVVARTRRGRRRVPLFAAALVAAAVSLLLVAPWSSGPSAVERAKAAIAAPAAGEILVEHVTVHLTPDLPPPRFRRIMHGRYWTEWTAQARIWLQGASPHRFRITLSASGRDAKGDPLRPQPSEIGGVLGDTQGLSYDVARKDLYPTPFRVPVRQRALDPAAFARSALASHRAHVVGHATIRGIDTIRIDIGTDTTYYVAAHSYQPVRVVIDNRRPLAGNPLPGMPFASLTLIQLATLPPAEGRSVFDFNRYERVPATAAARALTNIRAIHPNVPIV
jgi:hypothetical protein